MDYLQGYQDGYKVGFEIGQASMRQIMSMGAPVATSQTVNDTPLVKPKKKASAYNRKYKAAFRKVASKYKLKSGKWKKGGFKQAVKAAHKMAGRK
tara:strand:- start:1205 stop:1489 length:285 start_codon:yes stop_codon:yes gene_type:complete